MVGFRGLPPPPLLLPWSLRPLPHPFPRPPPLAASQPPLLHPRLWIFLCRCINELSTPLLLVLLNMHISVLLEEPPLLEAEHIAGGDGLQGLPEDPLLPGLGSLTKGLDP